MEIIEKNKHHEKLKYSDNKIFLLVGQNPHEIFIKEKYLKIIESQNSDFYNYLLITKQSSRLKNNTIFSEYVKATVKKEFEIKGKNDCLLFAERIALNKPDYEKDASVFSVFMGTRSKKFGVSDKNNSEIVRYIRNQTTKKAPLHNLEVDPKIKDAYSMVPHDIPVDTGICPYHAATVIFKDGNTNITIEADAGLDKIHKPIFDMYSTTIHKYSFFKRHMPTYLQHIFDNDKKIKFKLPTVLHLTKTYKELKPKKLNKENEKLLLATRRSSRLNISQIKPPSTKPEKPPSTKPEKPPSTKPEKPPSTKPEKSKPRKNPKTQKKFPFRGR